MIKIFGILTLFHINDISNAIAQIDIIIVIITPIMFDAGLFVYFPKIFLLFETNNIIIKSGGAQIPFKMAV
jgi:hypothetical protein